MMVFLLSYQNFKNIRDKGRTSFAWKWGEVGRRGWGGGQGGEMTQTMYAYANK
jgi:hypothetical protein